MEQDYEQKVYIDNRVSSGIGHGTLSYFVKKAFMCMEVLEILKMQTS